MVDNNSKNYIKVGYLEKDALLLWKYKISSVTLYYRD